MRANSTTCQFYAGPQAAGTPAKFWNIASTGEDSGEILLYGEVFSRHPVDWWTGEPEPGLFITPEGFLEDLAAVKGKNSLTIKINSVGGDLYTGIAIHDAIKGLAGHKTVIVEGIAASAASVIACAGDEVQIYAGGMIMIHGVSGLLQDFYSLPELKRLEKEFDAAERAIAKIYQGKTGLETDQLRSMMSRETWMVGQEAVDYGFADTLLEGAGPEVTLSAEKKVLLVAGIRHSTRGLHNIPGSIPVLGSIPEQTGISNNTPGKPAGQKGKDDKPMTMEEMKAQFPELVAQIEREAAEAAKLKEQERLKSIDSIAASVGDEQLLQAAKYGAEACTAEQLALKAMQKQAALGQKHLENVGKDYADSGAARIGAAPNSGAEGEETDVKAQVDNIVGLYNATKGGKRHE